MADAPVSGPQDDAARAGVDPAARRPLTARRLLGLDRSGPPPAATLAGAPLNPWTIPNAIGFARLALIPVFLIVALSSDDGVGAPQAILFAVIGWGDYADGMAARITRQYSRLGTLMDPVTDRLLVICGVIVNWHFALLPRWALAVLVARELLMLVVGRYGLKRGVDLRINWPGRLAVAPVMGGLFFPMCGLGTLGEVLLYIGLALALAATALYLRDGWRIMQMPRPSS
ncbi:MAG TPA: CDP-alcohol phosphatidyltransferase family protein [Conexibacter sp.]|nr:CDP-alcohol phosphatidyltransferase family protein [Conexibacter sp.]